MKPFWAKAENRLTQKSNKNARNILGIRNNCFYYFTVYNRYDGQWY